MSKNTRKKVMLVILDGYGIGHDDATNAMHLAKPKTINHLMHDFPSVKIEASEEAVALPKGQPGNSEVGHLTIGAGRIFPTGLSLISTVIKNKEFFSNAELLKAIDHAKKHQSNVHILGLASNGDVHSSILHLYAMIEMCNQNKVIPVIDLFCDGRDTDKNAFLEAFKEIKIKFLDTNKAKLGIIAGRYYAMDRNGNWDRTIATFDTLIAVNKDHQDPTKYIESCYANNENDEFIKPKSFNNAATSLKENDTMIFFNFRSDRIRQLIHLFTNNLEDYQHQLKESFPVYIVGFMDYKLIGMKNIAFIQPVNYEYLGKIVADHNLKQLRIAETEKYAHVTYFLDSMHKEKAKNTECILIPSPTVTTYDQKPEMSAKYITDYLIANFEKFDLIVANYANADMVGHTGMMKATIKAIECLDHEIHRLYDAVKKNDEYIMIITADHGNADEMLDKNGNIITRHTINHVPFIVLDHSIKLQNKGSLVNVAPTILELLHIEIPKNMEKSLIIK